MASLKGKTQVRFTNKMVTLDSPETVLKWKRALEKHLKGMFWLHHIKYDVQKPSMLLNRAAATARDVLDHFPETFDGYELVSRLPARVKRSISEAKLVQGYTEQSKRVPDEIEEIIEKAALTIRADDKLYIYCDDENSRKSLRDLWKEARPKILSIFEATVSDHLHDEIDDTDNPYVAFDNLMKVFHINKKAMQSKIRTEFRQIRFTTLGEYVRSFQTKLREYKAVDGSEMESILDQFKRGMAMCYRDQLLMMKDDADLEEHISHFRRIAGKEDALPGRDSKPRKFKSENPQAKFVKAKLKKIKRRPSKERQVIRVVREDPAADVNIDRCHKCGGVGHPHEACPTKGYRCFICKKPNHKARDCPNKDGKRFVRMIQEFDPDYDEPVLVCIEADNVEAESESDSEAETDSKSEDDAESGAVGRVQEVNDLTDYEDFDDFQSVHRVLNIGRVDVSRQCDCFFGSDCCKVLIDTGCPLHLCQDQALMTEIYSGPRRCLSGAFGSGEQIEVKSSMYGTVKIKLENGQEIQIKGALHAPGLRDAVILSPQCMPSFNFIIQGPLMRVLSKDMSKLISEATKDIRQGVFFFHSTVEIPESVKKISEGHTPEKQAKCPVLAAEKPGVTKNDRTGARSWLNHFRFGHINDSYLSKAGLKTNTCKCPACLMFKSTQPAKNKEVVYSSSELIKPDAPGSVITADIIGPFTRDIRKRQYILVIQDIFTNFGWGLVIATKDKAVGALINHMQLISNSYQKSIRALRTDGGSEFKSKLVAQYCASLGIKQEFSSPYFHSENGKVERSIRYYKEASRAVLGATFNVPQYLWSFAVCHCIKIWNMIPRKNETLSPHELFFQRKPPLDRFKVFGARGYARKTEEKRKLIDKSTFMGFYMGFSDTSKQFLIYRPDKKKVVEVRHVYFDELRTVDRFLNHHFKELSDLETKRKNVLEQNFQDIFNSKSSMKDQTCITEGHTASNAGQSSGTSGSNWADILEKNVILGKRTRKQVVRAVGHTEGDVFWKQFLQINDELINRTISQKLSQVVEDRICSITMTVPPKNYNEILLRKDKPKWLKAYSAEMWNMIHIALMELAKRPKDQPVYPLIELFIVKNNTFTGEHDEAKVRFVLNGAILRKREGLKKGEVYSPVSNQLSLRLLMHVSARFEFRLAQADIKAAFLYGKLPKPVYVKLPAGHKAAKDESLCWKCSTNLYGLPSAPRTWYEAFSNFLLDLKLILCETTECFFYKLDAEKNVVGYLIMYVDDILITGTQKFIHWLESSIKKKFRYKWSNDPEAFLGTQIKKVKNGFVLHNSTYISELAAKCGLDKAKVKYSTPLPTGCLDLVESPFLDNVREFQQLLGSLIYLSTTTRPDIAVCCSLLGRHGSRPRKCHLTFARRLLKFVYDSRDMGLLIQGSSDSTDELKVYSDASWNSHADGKCTQGFLLFLGKSLVWYGSNVQTGVPLSSCEAEAVALAVRTQKCKVMLQHSRRVEDKSTDH